MGVFRDIVIPLGGRDYTVTPSVRVLRAIEGKGRKSDPSFNLVAMVVRASQMDGHLYDLAWVLSELINASGGKVSDDDALAAFMAFERGEDLRDYIGLIASCIMPEVKAGDEKKPEAGT